MKILVVPIGKIDSETLKVICDAVEKIFRCTVAAGKELLIPEDSYSSRRKQYYSTRILDTLSIAKTKDFDRLLGVADADLYVPELNFVFGEADLSSGVAIISLARLRQEFYGLSPDRKLFQARTVKEAVHEIGHTLGLTHCPDPQCVMHFSNSLRDTDRKSQKFCSMCMRRMGLKH